MSKTAMDDGLSQGI